MKSILVVRGAPELPGATVLTVAQIRAATGASVHLVGTHGWAGRQGHYPHPARDLTLRAGGVPWVEEPPVVESVTLLESISPDAVLAHAARVQAELIVLTPDPAAETGLMWLDPAAMRIAAAAECAVLVAREGYRWPPERVLLPLMRADVEQEALVLAWNWIRAATGAPVRIGALLVARDASDWYDGLALLAGQIEGLETPAAVETASCLRFGSAPWSRVVERMRAEPADLLVLNRRRPAAGEDAEGAEDWLRVLGESRCSVLLLPTGALRRHPAAASARAEPRGWKGWWGGRRDPVSA